MILSTCKYSGVRQGYPQVVPCGSCIGCRAEQGRQWAVRMMHESRLHESSLFVTLTLDDKHLNENRELCAKDFSGFIKRLRKTQEGRLSYFGCGEYGEKNGRPHYHALLFNMRFLDMYSGDDDSGRDFWRSKTLDRIWGRGHTEMGSVTMGSCSYVAGYIRKKVKAKFAQRVTRHGEIMTPEFARMSLRPAIGLKWIQTWWRDVYPRDYVVVDGVEAKPPKYYDKFMDFEDIKGGSQERRDVMEVVRSKRYDEAIDFTHYQLKAGEAIMKSRNDLFAGRDRV